MMTTNPISIASYGQNPLPWRTNMGGLGVVDPITASAAAPKVFELLTKIKPIAKVAEKVGSLAAKIGIGGVTQDRFIDRTMEVYSIFDDAGYKYTSTKPTDNGLYKEFQIGKSQVTDKKTSGNYSAEFERLRKYIIARLNAFNPGLGDLYGQYFPEFRMANLGQMIGEPIVALKDFVKIKPGTFTNPLQIQQILSAAQSPVSPASPAAPLAPPTSAAPGTPPPPAQQSSSTGWLIGGGVLAAAISMLK